jgi:hypothetical protein
MRSELRLLYLPLLLAVSAGFVKPGRSGAPVVDLRPGPDHLLTAAPKAYRVAATKDGDALLIRGDRVLQTSRHMRFRPLSDGLEVTRDKEIREHGKVIATLNLDHDLKDDAFWGSHEMANTLRYHQGRGGVFPSITTILPESRNTAILVVSWRSVSLSGQAPLVHQLVRLRLRKPMSATALVSIGASYDSYLGEWPAVFVQDGKVLLYSNQTLHQVIPSAKGKSTDRKMRFREVQWTLKPNRITGFPAPLGESNGPRESLATKQSPQAKNDDPHLPSYALPHRNRAA